MSLVLLTGGARSGKSSAAVALATATGAPVTFVATATAIDADMASRIATHRAERPSAWSTIEAPFDLVEAAAGVDPTATLIIDCLTLWVFNRLHRGDDHETLTSSAEILADSLAERPGTAIVVTNEVGSGIVPGDSDTRRYRDVLGRVNTTISLSADEAHLMVAGRRLVLERLDLERIADP